MARARTTKPPSAPKRRGGDPQALVTWASALAEKVDRAEPGGALVAAPWEGDPLAIAVVRFALDEVERAIFAVLVAAARSFPLSRRLRALGGTTVTVEVVAALCEAAGLAGVIERLTPRGRLRAHALVHVEGEERLAAGSDAIRLEVGLEPRAAADAELDEITIVDGVLSGERGGFVQRLGGNVPAVVALEPPSAGSEAATARAIADGLGRRVFCWHCAQPMDAGRARRLRRNADLEGAVLVAWGAATPIAALLSTPPAGAETTPLVVLLTAALDEKIVRAPWTLRRDKVVVEVTRTAAPITEIDRIRALAQRDADRALGIVRPEPPPRLVVPGKIVDTSVRVVEGAPPKVSTPSPSPPPTPSNTMLPLAAAESGPITLAAARTDSGPIPTLSPTPTPTPTPTPSAPDGPRVDVPADATPEVRARAAIHSPSAAQRIELLQSLAGIKSPAVVAALRHNVRSEHVALRETAETLMTALFGPAWNRSRAIPPPVQTPPSDDGGRGPGGAL